MSPLVLVDTSVWVAHFRTGLPGLADLLARDAVLCHPWVLGELACGTPPRRQQTLDDVAELRSAQVASIDEILAFIGREQLYGLGCGLVDTSLLASTLMTPSARLWTLDRRLSELAQRFGVGFASAAV
jgi:predicted nucleic acid-binding protein